MKIMLGCLKKPSLISMLLLTTLIPSGNAFQRVSSFVHHMREPVQCRSLMGHHVMQSLRPPVTFLSPVTPERRMRFFSRNLMSSYSFSLSNSQKADFNQRNRLALTSVRFSSSTGASSAYNKIGSWNKLQGTDWRSPVNQMLIDDVDGTGKKLIVGLEDGVVGLYDFKSDSWHELQGNTYTKLSPVNQILIDDVDGIGKKLIVGLEDGAVKLYDFTSKRWDEIQPDNETNVWESPVKKMLIDDVDGTGKNLIVGLESGAVKLYNFTSKRWRELPTVNCNSHVSQLLVNDQKQLIVGLGNGAIKLYDFNSEDSNPENWEDLQQDNENQSFKKLQYKTMKPNKIDTAQSGLFMNRLSNQLNPKDPLFIMVSEVNWSFFEESFNSHYADGPGQPPKPVRLMVGLMLLQHMHGLSDEQVVYQWVQNPYWQYFCGYDYLQWDLPCDPSSLTRWRTRLGEEGVEKIFGQTTLKTQAVAPQDLNRVISDTTDTKLLNKEREKLVGLASRYGKLRQTYARTRRFAALNAGQYAHTKQFKRMRKEVKKLKNLLGRTARDVER